MGLCTSMVEGLGPPPPAPTTRVLTQPQHAMKPWLRMASRDSLGPIGPCR